MVVVVFAGVAKVFECTEPLGGVVVHGAQPSPPQFGVDVFEHDAALRSSRGSFFVELQNDFDDVPVRSVVA